MKVIKIGGQIINDPSALANALTHEGQFVVVHGAGTQLNQVMPDIRVNGLRITPNECIQELNRIVLENAEIVASALQALGRTIQHVQPLPAQAIPNLGRTGTVSSIPSRIQQIIDEGDVPIIGPRGWDGATLNVNADDIAQAIAISLRADELVLVSQVGAVLDAEGNPLLSLTQQDAMMLVSSGIASGGMVPKLQAVNKALTAGVRTVRITAPGLAGTSIQ